MAETTRFEALGDEIVREVFPDQRKFWSANKKQVISRIISNQAAESEKAPEGDFKFVGELVLGIQIAGGAASLLASLVAVYATIRSMPKSDEPRRLDMLRSMLSQSQVAADDAARIVRLFETKK